MSGVGVEMVLVGGTSEVERRRSCEPVGMGAIVVCSAAEFEGEFLVAITTAAATPPATAAATTPTAVMILHRRLPRPAWGLAGPFTARASALAIIMECTRGFRLLLSMSKCVYYEKDKTLMEKYGKIEIMTL
eukprot:comp22105_c0_seq1/m.32276 comp22105_c0_seq1/g.32276  ORF comp22105_c0_seq1/g.32276 comp22105_c0_seq1/m.32276 type:complete len:132 (+) comp22105_c0_seq1:1962-2357(+)